MQGSEEYNDYQHNLVSLICARVPAALLSIVFPSFSINVDTVKRTNSSCSICFGFFQCWRSNLGPHTCSENILPLSYILGPFLVSLLLTFYLGFANSTRGFMWKFHTCSVFWESVPLYYIPLTPSILETTFGAFLYTISIYIQSDILWSSTPQVPLQYHYENNKTFWTCQRVSGTWVPYSTLWNFH